MKRENLRPFLKRWHWLVPIFGMLCLLASPVLVPVLVMLANMSDVRDAFNEILSALRYKPWGQEE